MSNREAQTNPASEATGIDRRRYPRLPIRLTARFLRANGEEHACDILNISAGGMFFETDAKVEAGEKIVAYVEELQRFEGKVARLCEGGFGMEFQVGARKLQRTLSSLSWLANKHFGEDPDLLPQTADADDNAVIVTLDSGEQLRASVVELWLTGVRLKTPPVITLDSHVKVGKTQGRVVRTFRDGVSIEFDASSTLRQSA